MSERDVTDDPLDPELDHLLESERSRPELPGTGVSADRLLSRVLVTVGPLPPAEGGPSEPGATNAGPITGGTSGASTAAGAALAHPAVIGAIALVIGVVAGAAMHATLASPEIRYVERTVAATSTEPLAREHGADPQLEDEAPSDTTEVVAPPITTANDALPTPSEDLSRSTRARAPDAGVTSALSRESSLLHRAQSALARGAPELAITALREHELRHPEGQLREERDALWISALAAQGDRDAALARATRFRERFPGSPLQPAIDASLRAP